MNYTAVLSPLRDGDWTTGGSLTVEQDGKVVWGPVHLSNSCLPGEDLLAVYADAVIDGKRLRLTVRVADGKNPMGLHCVLEDMYEDGQRHFFNALYRDISSGIPFGEGESGS